MKEHFVGSMPADPNIYIGGLLVLILFLVLYAVLPTILTVAFKQCFENIKSIPLKTFVLTKITKLKTMRISLITKSKS